MGWLITLAVMGMFFLVYPKTTLITLVLSPFLILGGLSFYVFVVRHGVPL